LPNFKVPLGILLFAHAVMVAIAFAALTNRIELSLTSETPFTFPFPFSAIAFVSVLQAEAVTVEFAIRLIAELTWIIKKKFRQYWTKRRQNYRRKNDLCLYCGAKKVMLMYDCPNCTRPYKSPEDRIVEVMRLRLESATTDEEREAYREAIAELESQNEILKR